MAVACTRGCARCSKTNICLAFYPFCRRLLFTPHILFYHFDSAVPSSVRPFKPADFLYSLHIQSHSRKRHFPARSINILLCPTAVIATDFLALCSISCLLLYARYGNANTISHEYFSAATKKEKSNVNKRRLTYEYTGFNFGLSHFLHTCPLPCCLLSLLRPPLETLMYTHTQTHTSHFHAIDSLFLPIFAIISFIFLCLLVIPTPELLSINKY